MGITGTGLTIITGAVNIVCYCALGYRSSAYVTALQTHLKELQTSELILFLYFVNPLLQRQMIIGNFKYKRRYTFSIKGGALLLNFLRVYALAEKNTTIS